MLKESAVANVGTTGNEYYTQARIYDARVRRFHTQDPESGKVTEPITINKYVYAGENPINYVDPDGRSYIANAIREICSEIKGYFEKAACVIDKAISEMSIPQKILTAVSFGLLAYAVGVPAETVLTTIYVATSLGAVEEAVNYTFTTDNWNQNDYWNSVANGAADGGMAGGASALAEGIFGSIKWGDELGSIQPKSVGGESGSSTRRQSFRQAKEAAGIPKSAQYKHHEFVYDGSTENRIVYEFDVNGKSKYVIEHPFDKNGRGKHFHGADDKYGSPYNKGTYNQYDGHFPEDFDGFE